MFTLEIYKTCTLGGDSEFFRPTGVQQNVTALIA